MKQNYKTKYFLKTVLDLAYCAKKANRNFIYLKTKNLTIPFSNVTIKRYAKDCEALTLIKEGGYISEETGKFEANHYSFDFDLLQKIYNENKAPLRNLKKEAEKKEIKPKKDAILLTADNFTFSSKLRGKYRIESIEQGKQALLDSKKYGSLYKRALDDIMVLNATLDEPRKIRFEPNFHLNKNNCISKIGIRATNSLVSAKAHNTDIFNPDFHGFFKEDILKQYSLKEFDNSDVSSSVPRLNAVYNGIDKWNDEKDYYTKIFNVCISKINKERKQSKQTENRKCIFVSSSVCKYICYTNSLNNNYLLFIPPYIRTKETEVFRDNIKPLVLPAYFDASKGNFIWHLIKAEIEYSGKMEKFKKGLLKKEPKRRDTGKVLDFWKRWCDNVGISLSYFLEILFDSIKEVIGEFHSSEIFFIESCAYLRVYREVVGRGYQTWQVYDSLCTDEIVEDLNELYEKYVNEVINEMKSNSNNKSNSNDNSNSNSNSIDSNKYICYTNSLNNNNYLLISSSSTFTSNSNNKSNSNDNGNSNSKDIVVDSSKYNCYTNSLNNNNYLLIPSSTFTRKKRDESKGRKKRDESKGRKKRAMTEQTKSILLDKESGLTNKQIAEKYGLSIQRIGQILKANRKPY